MKKFLPVILVLVGIGGGVGAGLTLRPEPEPEVVAEGCGTEEECASEERVLAMASSVEIEDPDAEREYAKLSKQFVVPVVKNDKVRALVVLSISIEVEAGGTDAVFLREPKLRDGFLQVLFEHANTGGFDGTFTSGESMRDLRGSLKEVAKRMAGPVVHDILITELVKQAL